MDIANLTGRLAVMQGVVEDLVCGATSSTWSSGRQTSHGTLIPGEDMDALYAMLHLIRSMN